MAKVTIINEIKEKEKRKQDIEIYNDMLQEINTKLKEGELGYFVVKKEKGVMTIFKDARLACMINPSSLEGKADLCMINIEVHDKNLFDYIKKISENHSNKYNNVNNIVIRTYF